MMISIYTDGGARGNPGHAGIGVVAYDEKGNVLKKHKKYIGTATNNVAEYEALIAGIEIALELKASTLRIFMDSELIVRQMIGRYKVKNEVLLTYFMNAQNLIRDFKKVVFTHIPREKNKAADILVNEAIDQQLAKPTTQG